MRPVAWIVDFISFYKFFANVKNIESYIVSARQDKFLTQFYYCDGKAIQFMFAGENHNINALRQAQKHWGCHRNAPSGNTAS